jgi:hypothetical protein
MDGWKRDKVIDKGMDDWMDGWLDGGMEYGFNEDGWMECQKTLKLGIIFMPKTLMKVEGKYIYIYIYKDENNLGIYNLVNIKYISTF